MQLASAPDLPPPVRAYATPIALSLDGSSCAGRVLDAERAPVPGAQVVVYEDSYGYEGEHRRFDCGSTTTDAAGGFTLEVERVFDWWRLRIGVVLDGQRRFLGRLVPAGGATDIVLPIRTMLPLRVVFDDGTPVSNSPVVDGHPEFRTDWEGGEHRPLYRLSRTDDAGRCAVPVFEGQPSLSIRVEHEQADDRLARPLDLAAWRQTPDEELVVQVPRLACLVVDLIGDQSPWTERGLGPGFLLEALLPTDDGGWIEKTRLGSVVRWYPASDTDGVRFPRVDPGPVRLRQWGNVAAVVFEGLELPPGITRRSYALPPPRPLRPGEQWYVPVRFVDRNGEPLSTDHPDAPPVFPDLIATGRTGRTSPVQVQTGGRAGFDLEPPIRIDMVGFGPEFGVADITPAGEAHIVWDPDQLAALMARVTVDVRNLDGLVDAAPTLSLRRSDSSSYGQKYAPPIDVAVYPGSWKYTLSGPRTVRQDGELQAVPGGRLELVAQSVAPRPPGIVYGTVVGRVQLLSDDPWLLPSVVRSKPLSDTDTSWVEERIHFDAYRIELPEGLHELTFCAGRIQAPEQLMAQVDGLWDVSTHRIPQDWDISVTHEVQVIGNEVLSLDVVLDAEQHMGTVFVEFTLLERETETWRQTLTQRPVLPPSEWNKILVAVTDTEGALVESIDLYDWPAQGVSLFLPPGDYRVHAMGGPVPVWPSSRDSDEPHWVAESTVTVRAGEQATATTLTMTSR